jgi:hypothetical protein
MTSINKKQVALVLQAIAEIEGWDGDHESVDSHPDRGWSQVLVNSRWISKTF